MWHRTNQEAGILDTLTAHHGTRGLARVFTILNQAQALGFSGGNMAGLLGNMGAAPMQPQGGLLGAPAQNNDAQKAASFANALMQNPSAQVAQMIISDLQTNPAEGAQNLALALSQSMDNPDALKQIAQIMNQNAGRQNG